MTLGHMECKDNNAVTVKGFMPEALCVPLRQRPLFSIYSRISTGFNNRER